MRFHDTIAALEDLGRDTTGSEVAVDEMTFKLFKTFVDIRLCLGLYFLNYTRFDLGDY